MTYKLEKAVDSLEILWMIAVKRGMMDVKLSAYFVTTTMVEANQE